jgi:hypothetical protein
LVRVDLRQRHTMVTHIELSASPRRSHFTMFSRTYDRALSSL